MCLIKCYNNTLKEGWCRVPLVASPLAYEHSAVIIHAVAKAVAEENSVMMRRKRDEHGCTARVVAVECVFEDVLPLPLPDLP